MKRSVTDLQDIRVELDEEDKELMKLFPRSRMAALDERLLVRRGEEVYLVRKEDAARWKKVMIGLFMTASLLLGAVYLALAVYCAVTGAGSGWLFLCGFELLLLPYLIRVPGDVRGGGRA